MRIFLVMLSLFIFFIGGDAWGQIMQLPRPIQPSPRTTTGLSQVVVPEVRGWTIQQAARRLQNVGLTAIVARRHSRQPPGTVIDQEPKPGTRVNAHSQIRLVVAAPGG
jgi:hypothetical protein